MAPRYSFSERVVRHCVSAIERSIGEGASLRAHCVAGLHLLIGEVHADVLRSLVGGEVGNGETAENEGADSVAHSSNAPDPVAVWLERFYAAVLNDLPAAIHMMPRQLLSYVRYYVHNQTHDRNLFHLVGLHVSDEAVLLCVGLTEAVQKLPSVAVAIVAAWPEGMLEHIEAKLVECRKRQ